MRRLALLALAGLLFAAPTLAATLNEADVPGGAFSPSWSSPTEVGAGFDAISGTGSSGVFDNFVFTALPSGAQTLNFAFSAPAGHGDSYSAGGEVYYSNSAFRWGWDGSKAGVVQLSHAKPTSSFNLSLGDNFSGLLYLAMNFTHGNLSYNIAVPSNAAISPVPLPAGLVLMGTGVVALLGLRRRRSAVA